MNLKIHILNIRIHKLRVGGKIDVFRFRGEFFCPFERGSADHAQARARESRVADDLLTLRAFGGKSPVFRAFAPSR